MLYLPFNKCVGGGGGRGMVHMIEEKWYVHKVMFQVVLGKEIQYFSQPVLNNKNNLDLYRTRIHQILVLKAHYIITPAHLVHYANTFQPHPPHFLSWIYTTVWNNHFINVKLCK